MSLLLSGVAFVYGEGTSYAQPALSDVSMEVSPGQLALVSGSTGSGKSTLLRLCAGLLAPTGGEISVDGIGAVSDPAEARRSLGLVFQNPESQLFAESVIDDIMFGPRNLGRSPEEAREAATRALRDVGLAPEDYSARSPFSLSGGEARRVAVAGILAMRPRYLLLDEPTAGLDSSGRSAVLSAVAVARREAGIVVVSHDPEEWLGVADSVLLLSGGRTVYSGSAEGVTADPAPFYAAGLRPPPVLETQILARHAGLELPSLSLDPLVAAQTLAAARREFACD